MANGVAASAYKFDTHAFVKRLTGAGLSVEAAETLADEQSHLVEQVASNVASVASNAASKEELKEHKTVLKEYKSDMKEDFKRLEASLDAKFSTIETRLDSKFESQRKDMELLKKDMTIRLGNMVLAGAGLVVVILKYLP